MKRISWCCCSCIIGLLFPDPFLVSDFSDKLQVLQIIRQCSFEALLAFLEYRRLTRMNLGDIRFVGWLNGNGRADVVLNIPEPYVPGKSQGRNGALVTEVILPVGVIYEPFARMTLNDVHEIVRLVLTEDRRD